MDRIEGLNRLKATVRKDTERVTREMLQFVWQGVQYARPSTVYIWIRTNYIQNYMRHTLKKN